MLPQGLQSLITHCARTDAEQTSLWIVSITIAIATEIFTNGQRTSRLLFLKWLKSTYISIKVLIIVLVLEVTLDRHLYGLLQSRHQLSGSLQLQEYQPQWSGSLVQFIIASYLDSHRSGNIQGIEMVFKKACFINRRLLRAPLSTAHH